MNAQGSGALVTIPSAIEPASIAAQAKINRLELRQGQFEGLTIMLCAHIAFVASARNGN